MESKRHRHRHDGGLHSVFLCVCVFFQGSAGEREEEEGGHREGEGGDGEGEAGSDEEALRVWGDDQESRDRWVTHDPRPVLWLLCYVTDSEVTWFYCPLLFICSSELMTTRLVPRYIRSLVRLLSWKFSFISFIHPNSALSLANVLFHRRKNPQSFLTLYFNTTQYLTNTSLCFADFVAQSFRSSWTGAWGWRRRGGGWSRRRRGWRPRGWRP